MKHVISSGNDGVQIAEVLHTIEHGYGTCAKSHIP